MKLRRNLTALVLGLSTIAACLPRLMATPRHARLKKKARLYLIRTGSCKYKLVLRILWEKPNSET